MLGNNSGSSLLQLAIMAGLGGMGQGPGRQAIPGAKPTVMANPAPPTSPGFNDYGAPPSLPVLPQMGTPIPQIGPSPMPRMPGINPYIAGLFGGR